MTTKWIFSLMVLGLALGTAQISNGNSCYVTCSAVTGAITPSAVAGLDIDCSGFNHQCVSCTANPTVDLTATGQITVSLSNNCSFPRTLEYCEFFVDSMGTQYANRCNTGSFGQGTTGFGSPLVQFAVGPEIYHYVIRVDDITPGVGCSGCDCIPASGCSACNNLTAGSFAGCDLHVN